MVQATVLYDSQGYYVEWYADDDNDSGLGASPRKAIWGGSRDECHKLALKKNPPKGLIWEPITGWNPDTSPGGASWCETASDNY